MIHVVYGPPGCGKTRSAQSLMRLLDCTTVIDGWEEGGTRDHQRQSIPSPIPPRTLVLTNADEAAIRQAFPGAKIHSFDSFTIKRLYN